MLYTCKRILKYPFYGFYEPCHIFPNLNSWAEKSVRAVYSKTQNSSLKENNPNILLFKTPRKRQISGEKSGVCRNLHFNFAPADATAASNNLTRSWNSNRAFCQIEGDFFFAYHRRRRAGVISSFTFWHLQV